MPYSPYFERLFRLQEYLKSKRGMTIDDETVIENALALADGSWDGTLAEQPE